MSATMEPLVDTLIEDPRWEALDIAALAERAAAQVLAHLGLEAAGFEIVLMACDDSRISALNAEFRGKPAATNVLSWPSEERAAVLEGDHPQPPEPGPAGMPESLGDIALAYETCAREAQEQGKPLSDHATHLIVHGVLHLLGYDHMRDKDAALMEALEVAILAKMGIPDPYEHGATAPE